MENVGEWEGCALAVALGIIFELTALEDNLICLLRLWDQHPLLKVGKEGAEEMQVFNPVRMGIHKFNGAKDLGEELQGRMLCVDRM